MNRKSIFVLCAVGAAGAFVACSQGNVIPTPGNTAGATGTTAGATGVSGSAGSPATSGAPATGGDVGTSGAPTTTGGDSGSVAGASGSGTAGTTDSAGSTSGGATGSGGAPTAGSAGMSSAGSGGGGLTPEAIVPTLDGFLWVGTCDASGPAGNAKDCPIGSVGVSCPNEMDTDWYKRGAFRVVKHQVAGTPGTKYMINFEARGVTGGKSYNNGTRQSSAPTPSETANDGWYVGGEPTPSKWNTYEIHVSPPVPGQPLNPVSTLPVCPDCPTAADNVYYTNAINGGDNTHETFPIKFNASFPVLGGGTITFVIHDSNCQGQQNCGYTKSPTDPCPVYNATMTNSGPRVIDLSGMSPAAMPKPPVSMTQPFSQPHSPNPFYPQWLLLDVKSVTKP